MVLNIYNVNVRSTTTAVYAKKHAVYGIVKLGHLLQASLGREGIHGLDSFRKKDNDHCVSAISAISGQNPSPPRYRFVNTFST